jgi:hypothetical protein
MIRIKIIIIKKIIILQQSLLKNQVLNSKTKKMINFRENIKRD